jgi:hypothetical protein
MEGDEEEDDKDDQEGEEDEDDEEEEEENDSEEDDDIIMIEDEDDIMELEQPQQKEKRQGPKEKTTGTPLGNEVTPRVAAKEKLANANANIYKWMAGIEPTLIGPTLGDWDNASLLRMVQMADQEIRQYPAKFISINQIFINIFDNYKI